MAYEGYYAGALTVSALLRVDTAGLSGTATDMSRQAQAMRQLASRIGTEKARAGAALVVTGVSVTTPAFGRFETQISEFAELLGETASRIGSTAGVLENAQREVRAAKSTITALGKGFLLNEDGSVQTPPITADLSSAGSEREALAIHDGQLAGIGPTEADVAAARAAGAKASRAMTNALASDLALEEQLQAGYLKGGSTMEALRALSITVNFVPVVGDAKGLVEAATGQDVLTGDDLTAFDRALATSGSVIPIVGDLAYAGRASRVARETGSLVSGSATATTTATRTLGGRTAGPRLDVGSTGRFDTPNSALARDEAAARSAVRVTPVRIPGANAAEKLDNFMLGAQDFRTYDEAKVYGKGLYKQVSGKLSGDERPAIAKYTAGSGDFNHYLRDQDRVPNARTDQLIGHMDAAIAKSVLPDDLSVVRGVNPNAFDRPVEELIGTVQKDRGYVSTTIGRETDPFFATREVELHLRVPAGSNGLPLDKLSKTKGENELLLPRDTQYRITDLEVTAEGKYVVFGEVLRVPPR